jgi:hypothetical protein
MLGQGTGSLESVRIDSSNGKIVIYKPDTWLDDIAFREALGKTVEVRIVITVAA